MARRRRTVEQEWYDVFSDADPSEQQIMLRTLEQIHRQVRRGKLNGDKPEQREIELKEPVK